MKTKPLGRIFVFQQSLLLVLVAAAVLWKGGKSLEMTWLLGAVSAALAFVPTGDRRMSAWVWWPWIAFLALGILSFLTTTAGNYGLDEIFRDLSLFFVACWIARQSDKTGFVRRFSAVITGAALLAVIVGVGVYAFQPVSRFVGTFFDWRFHTDYWPNAWADFVLLAWPMAAYTLWRKPMLMSAALGVLLGSLFLSFSRGGLLSLFAQLIVLGLIALVLSLRKRISMRSMDPKTVAMSAAILAITAGALFLGANTLRSQNFSLESVANKATFTASEGTSSVSERKSFWDAALTMAGRKPLLGYGPYSFRFVQPVYQTSVLATADHPHNVFLKIAAERGLPALVAFLLLLCAIASQPLRALVSTKKKGGSPLPLWTTLASVAVIGVLTHSLIDYNLQFVAVALPFWLLAATLIPATKKDARRQIAVEKIAAVAMLAVMCIEGAFLLTSSLGRHAEAAGDTQTAIAWYERSLPEIFSRDLLLSLSTLYRETGEKQKAMDILDRYQDINAVDARGWLLRAQAHEEDGQELLARLSYEIAWQNGRYNMLQPMNGLLRTIRATGDSLVLSAREEEFVETFNAFASAVLQNTHFIALSPAVEELQESFVLLQAAYPRQTGLRTLLKDAVLHAHEERGRLSERTPGLLW